MVASLFATYAWVIVGDQALHPQRRTIAALVQPGAPLSSTTDIQRPARVEPTDAQKAFRQAMAHLGAAVNVITTAGPHGRCGITASAVCSVTDTPPTLLVCLNRSSAMHAYSACVALRARSASPPVRTANA